tara:strand:+ start:39 stop:1292 length:1254 start_codon:yes stop_codon:yes gene_type:complete
LKLELSKQYLTQSKQLFPGGNTFSKTSFFDQGVTPFALSHGKGSQVWDVDGNRYTDFMLGLGCVNLGYCFEDVDNAITEQLQKGLSFSLPHPLETQVAQKLVTLIPCAEMVRFAKNGSDVLSAAVKLARYITRKDHVVSCGYHGWHDWCIANTSRPGGVPDATRGLTHRFVYNDIDSLEQTIQKLDNQVACVVMDVVARYYPEPGFLERVRELTEKHGIILIFDEIITGFRIHSGGAQAFFNVTPDLACFGKALANGMPISALVGKSQYMCQFDDLFFSLTFAGETLSLSAANAVLNLYRRIDVPEDLYEKGSHLWKGLTELLKKHNLNCLFELQGMPSRIILGVKSSLDSNFFTENEDRIHQLFFLMTQRLAELGILFSVSMFISYSHTYKDLDLFLSCFDEMCTSLEAEINHCLS